MVRLDNLGKFKKINDLIENRTRDFSACSDSTNYITRAPKGVLILINFKMMLAAVKKMDYIILLYQ
jgi:hypothetical protein